MEQPMHQMHVADQVAQKEQAIQSALRKLLVSGVIGLAGCLLANFAPFPLVSLTLMLGSVFATGWFARGLADAKKIDTRFHG